MTKIADFTGKSSTIQKLNRLSDELKQMKLELAEIAEDYETAEGRAEELLTEALDALEDASEMLEEIMEL